MFSGLAYRYQIWWNFWVLFVGRFGRNYCSPFFLFLFASCFFRFRSLVSHTRISRNCLVLLGVTVLFGCSDIWNSPHQNIDSNEKIVYSAFSESPKHLDPARSYSSDEFSFLENIYEPPLQYHYLKRPYQLIPLTAESIPTARLINDQESGKKYYAYDVKIKPNIYYAPHPAFATKRELIAADYVYQIKRLADPKNNSPVASLMASYIEGFEDYSRLLQRQSSIDLGDHQIAGVRLISRYHYQILLLREYPQFIYWLTLPFFAPMPYEVIAWNKKQNKQEENIDIKPIGTGPFMMVENNPNYRIVLQKKP